MQFKELKLYGFKSFAEETKLHFDSGVTAIVGPNGCGKSNLADAVKWVLGEQSAKELRGSTMEDVIFNGTTGLEPKGMAEVSLTFLNESNILPVDYDEVTITRKVYRSGESEYFLNKSKVRLKDIQNLIRGTGIGTSAYSIMEQGKIDLVLSSKPQDRRYIFEEASGITKYKGKKKETLNKLERTQDNLQRVNDIIGEVERQLRSIKRKVKKAQRYKKRFEKLENLEMLFSKIEYNRIGNEINTVVSNLENHDSKIKEAENVVDEVRKELLEVKEELNTVEHDLDILRNELIDINNNINESKSQTNLSQERVKDLETKIETLKKEQKELADKLKETKEKKCEFVDKIEQLENEKSEIKETLINIDERLYSIHEEASNDKMKIKNIKTELVDDMSSETNVKNEIVRINSDIRNCQNRTIRLNREKKDLENEQEVLMQKVKQIENQVFEISEKLEKEKIENREKHKELTSFEKESSVLETELNKHKTKYNEIDNKYNLLKQLKYSYEGFSSGIRNLTKVKQERGLNFEILAELAEVDKGYEAAVEVALDDYIQAIVVPNRKEAIKVLNVLDEMQGGICKIIVLDEFHPNIKKRRKIFFRRKIGQDLSAYVRPIKSKYKNLFKKILKGKYIVKNKEMALSLCKKGGNSYKSFITLNGELFQKGRFLTTQNKDKQQFSLIGRKSAINELNDKLSSLTEDMDLEKAKIADIKEHIVKIKENIKDLEDNISLTENNKRDKVNSLNSVKTDLEKIRDEYSVVKIDLDEVNEEMADLKEKKENIGQKHQEVSGKVEHKNKCISDYQDKINNLNKEKEELIVRKSNLESKFSGIKEKKQSCRERIDLFNDLLQEHEEKLDFSTKQKKVSEDGIFELENDIKTYNDKIIKLNLQKEKLIEKLDSLKENRRICTDKKDKLDDKLNEKQRFIQTKMHELQKVNTDKTQLEYKQQQIESRMMDKYKKELKEFEIDELKEKENLGNLKKEISILTEKLDSMGEVSLMAIEEHEDLKERYSFLINQREDLFQAEESLRKAIKKINKTTRSLFMETFNKIQKEFDVFFRSLFGGGKALLELQDEKDVLESGIDIIAQPKGKKLQNISLLSGGEKTLTAVALLFAIFKVKPSPFCLLDEIDAPLDEANIDRFSRILQEFIKNSQFIIITHNKKTISLADVIYGVTMEKSGISKIVSVKLIDEEDSNPKKVSITSK